MVPVFGSSELFQEGAKAAKMMEDLSVSRMFLPRAAVRGRSACWK
jgi:hypothetical protein